jgi:hypothetical protein
VGKVTIGYKYFVGMHMVLSAGPIDGILRIRVDQKDVYVADQDEVESGITINLPGLFGGEEREGGIEGRVDFLYGDADQPVNSYLAEKLPNGNVPAFRGTAGVVLNQVYVGTAPYPKPWEFKCQRIFYRSGDTEDNPTQWRQEFAAISRRFVFENTYLYIAVDRSTVNDQDGTWPNLWQDAVIESLKECFTGIQLTAAAYEFGLDQIAINVRLVFFSSTGATVVDKMAATNDDFDDLVDYVQTVNTSGDPSFGAAVSNALTFFPPNEENNNVFFLISPGDDPNDTLPAAITAAADLLDQNSGTYNKTSKSEVKMWAFIAGIDTTIDREREKNLAKLQNMLEPYDGLNGVYDSITPSTTLTFGGLVSSNVFGSFFWYSDMNPAHIIRECLTDRSFGMGYPENDIDETSFVNAAVLLKQEAMGISLIWDRQSSIEDFVREILKHIDAVLYTDRNTGKFILRLIRDDYDVNELPVFDETNIESVQDFTRSAFGELINSVTVNYFDGDTDTEASVTVTDTALAEAQGAVLNTTIQYPGFTYQALAARVAQRDLKSLSSTLINATLICNRHAATLAPGDAFRFIWPDYGVNVVMRVAEVAYGNDRENRVRIKAVQDVFTTPAVSSVLVTPAAVEWEPTQIQPAPVTNAILVEMPYLEIVQRVGQTGANDGLAEEPDAGYLQIAAARPQSQAINAIATRDGQFLADVAFSPTAVLADQIDEMTDIFEIINAVDLDLVNLGTFAQIDDELVAIETITQGSPGSPNTVMTVKRGILDTVPRPHLAGARFYFWDQFGVSQEKGFLAAEEADVKLLTLTGSGQLNPALAPEISLTFDSRAIRPYPPGQVKINGEYFPLAPQSTILVSWVDRNRLQQTGSIYLGFLDGGVTPEPGVTYRVGMELPNGTEIYSASGIEGSPADQWQIPDDELPGGVEYVWVTLAAERDGYESWQSHRIQVFLGGSGLGSP